MKQNIFDITHDLLVIHNELEAALEDEFDATGWTEHLQKIFKEVEGEFETKCEKYWYVLRELEAREKAISAEIKRLTERRNVQRNKISAVRDTLKVALVGAGKKKVETDLMQVRVQKGREKLEIDEDINPGGWPEEIRAVCAHQQWVVDKQSLRANYADDIRANKCEGARFIPSGPVLVVK